MSAKWVIISVLLGKIGANTAMVAQGAPAPQTAPTTRDAAITGFEASATDDRISLRWTAVPGSAAERYDVYRDTKRIGSTNGLTFEDVGLNPETRYRYRVKGSDLGGKIAEDLASIVLIVRTPARLTPIVKELNVKTFGAAGDGITNDQPAVARAVAALAKQGGGTLLFPAGTYRVTTPGDGVVIADLSDATLQFQANAVLLMDNLDAAGRGTGHGIVVRGKAQRLSIIGASVKWAHVPAERGQGDGIRFEGNLDKAISAVRTVRCSVENAPQTGSIFMGCSDVNVENFAATNTLADGLHFNACQQVKVSGVTGINTGDDTLAFVTYYDPSQVNIYPATPGSYGGPFAQPELGDWSDSNSTATGVLSIGSHANGVRIDGALNLQLSNVVAISPAVAGVQLDATIANGSTNAWTVQASQGVRIDRVYVRSADTGLLVHVQNVDYSSDPRFWKFQASIDNVTAVKCRNDNVNISQVQGVSLNGLNASGRRCRFVGDRGLSLDNINLLDGDLFLLGSDKPLTSMASMPVSNYTVGTLNVVGGKVQMQDLNGLTLTSAQLRSPTGDALTLNRILNATLASVTINDPAVNSRAVLLTKAHQTRIGTIDVESRAASLKAAVEVGGGDEVDVVDGLLIGAISWNTSLASPPDGVIIQGGPFAPRNWSAKLQVNRKSKTLNLGSGAVPPALLKAPR